MSGQFILHVGDALIIRQPIDGYMDENKNKMKNELAFNKAHASD